MGLSVNNLVVGEVKKELDTIATPAQTPTTTVTRRTTTAVESIKEPSVVVGGKVKKIGKKSAFLLDMLTLDD